MTMQALRRVPVVVVLGATGAGKSKLALELGVKFGGEIISADSMQVYQGLDIITNKVTPEEQLQCPHHLLGIVHPLQRFTVVDFRNWALPLIDGLIHKGKLPIIVGGTNYYIEALLWKVLLSNKENASGPLLYEAKGEVEKLRLKLPAYDSTRTSDSSDKHEKSNLAEETDKLSSNSDEVNRLTNAVSHGNRRAVIGRLNVSCDADEIESSAGSWGDQEAIGWSGPSNDQDKKMSNASYSCDRINSGSNFHTSPSIDRATNEETILNEHMSRTHQSSFDNDADDDGDVQYSLLDVDVNNASCSELHELLNRIDPEMANRLHPNDRRKVIRSLQVYEQHGIPHSKLLEDQRNQEGGTHLGGPLRYPDICVFWVQCSQEVLDARLDRRVDKMMEMGVLKELEDFHKSYNEQRLAGLQDEEEWYTQGIFQSIGFKEFHEYLILKDNEKKTEKGEKCLEEGTEKLKTATRQYARRQLKWIRNRFLKRGSNSPPVYGVDSTNPEEWDKIVLEPAIKILQDRIEGKCPSISPIPCEEPGVNELSQTFVCDICNRQFVGLPQWTGHLKSRRHQKQARKKRLRELTGQNRKALGDTSENVKQKLSARESGSPSTLDEECFTVLNAAGSDTAS